MRGFLIGSALLALATAPAAAQQRQPDCTDNSRACLVRAANSYLEALVTHDGRKPLVWPDIKRTEQGRYPVAGEAEIRHSMDIEPDMKGHANTRFYVDEEQSTVVYFTLLRVTGGKEEASRKTYTDDRPMPPTTTHLAERFKIDKGLIREIEAIFVNEGGSMDHPSGWPPDIKAASPAAKEPEAAPVVKPGCTDNSRACLIAAAKSYLDAVVTHDGSKVLIHPAIRRTQNGKVTAEGDAAIRASMGKEPDMLPHRNTRYFVDRENGTVIAFTLFPIFATNKDPNRPGYSMNGQPATTHLAERFRVEKGVITEVEAIHLNDVGTMDATSGWPDAAP